MDNTFEVKEKSNFSFIGKIFGAIIIILSLVFMFFALQPKVDVQANVDGSVVTEELQVTDTGSQPVEQKFNF